MGWVCHAQNKHKWPAVEDNIMNSQLAVNAKFCTADK